MCLCRDYCWHLTTSSFYVVFVSFRLDFPVPAAGSGWVILTLQLCAVDPKQTSNHDDSDPSYSIQFSIHSFANHDDSDPSYSIQFSIHSFADCHIYRPGCGVDYSSMTWLLNRNTEEMHAVSFSVHVKTEELLVYVDWWQITTISLL
jgi:hypothetical protein